MTINPWKEREACYSHVVLDGIRAESLSLRITYSLNLWILPGLNLLQRLTPTNPCLPQNPIKIPNQEMQSTAIDIMPI